MRFAVFHKLSTGYVAGSIPPRFDGPAKPIPALGSDGVMRFDGRYSLRHCAALARTACRKRGFIGFTIEHGESFTRSREARPFEYVGA